MWTETRPTPPATAPATPAIKPALKLVFSMDNQETDPAYKDKWLRTARSLVTSKPNTALELTIAHPWFTAKVIKPTDFTQLESLVNDACGPAATLTKLAAAVKSNYSGDKVYNIGLSPLFSVRSLMHTTKNNVRATIVVGSLGIGIGKPFWEWGGPQHRKLEDFLNAAVTVFAPGSKETLTIPCDGYMWVEDEAGLLYDVVNRYKFSVAKVHSKRLGVTAPRTLYGVTARQAAELGFHYLPAPATVQKQLTEALLQYADNNLYVGPRRADTSEAPVDEDVWRHVMLGPDTGMLYRA